MAKSKLVVVGAELYCPKGTCSGYIIDVRKDEGDGEKIEGKEIANRYDNEDICISSFGICEILDVPCCTEILTVPWIRTATTTYTRKNRVLLEKSITMCPFGAEIRVVSVGHSCEVTDEAEVDMSQTVDMWAVTERVARSGGGGGGAISEEEWDEIEDILNLPADRITTAQYLRLAQFFVAQDTLEGQERFLNLLADVFAYPMGNGNTSEVMPFSIIGPRDVPIRGDHIFTFCQGKVGNIQIVLNTLITSALTEQTTTVYGTIAHRILDDERHILSERSGLLSTVANLPKLMGYANDPINGHGPITLSPRFSESGEQNGTIVSFQEVDVREEFSLVPYGYRRFTVGMPQDRTLHVNPLLSSYRASHKLADLTMNRLLLNHEFDALALFWPYFRMNMTERLAGRFARVMGREGILPYLSIAFDILDVSGSLHDARINTRRIHADIVTGFNSTVFGLYLRDFSLDSVIVTDENNNAAVHTWPTRYTPGIIEIFNYHSGNNITWQEYLQNPNAVFQKFLGLSYDVRGNIADAANTHRNNLRSSTQ